MAAQEASRRPSAAPDPPGAGLLFTLEGWKASKASKMASKASSAPPAAPARGPGYGGRCRPCNSPHRVEIDQRLLAGESARRVSEWLAGLGETISHTSLLGHRTEHLDARAEAAALVEAATPVFSAAVGKIVADASVLDQVAGIALRTATALEKTVSTPSEKPSMAVVMAFNGALSAARGAVTDRHEMLHGKKLEVTGIPEPADPETLHARLADLVAAATGKPDPGPTRPPHGGAAG